MNGPDTEQLDRLVAWMQEGGFTRLTYSHGPRTIALTLPDGDAPATPRPLRTIASPGMGVFARRHPVAAEPYAGEGSRVAAGDVLALLAVGPVLTAVEAPCDGIIRRVIAAEGAVVGFDDPLFDIEPVEG